MSQFSLLFRRLFVPLTALMLAPAWAAAQTTGWEAGQLLLTRAELEQLLGRFEKLRTSPDWSSEFKLRAKSEAELVRRRLTDGDFQVGDQITLSVEGEFENRPVTLTIGPGRMVPIAGMQELALSGVLRSELNEKMRQHIARFIRNPVVRTEPLIRLSVMGQVGNPSVALLLPAQSLLSDAIMRAGGPTVTADIPKAFVNRGTEKIWEGDALQKAMADGRTLDQMQLRSGDQLTVPAQAGGRGASILRLVAIVPATILAITGILAIF
jgi:protein involved in polysaccharide export with SLBB domain